MIENLKPYVEYKDSGLPWLGNVLEQWIISTYTDFNKFMAEVEKDNIKNRVKFNSNKHLDEIVGSVHP